MQKKEIVMLLIFSLLAMFYSRAEEPHKGFISGVIIDKKTNETIVGANIVIQGTTIGATSDLDGKFVINNLKKGSYSIAISFISYVTVELDNIRTSESPQHDIVIELEESIASIEGVTIASTRVTNTEMSVINSIKSAGVIASGISAQQISKSQDKDGADIVKRIPGVNVMDNKYIRIRGLAERYNLALLNDATAPSMEADVRSFSFDVVPASLIDRILIYKSPSADLPGDFSGGLVEIFTKSIPEVPFIEINYGTSYRDGSSMKQFLGQETSSTSWTGFNDGRHDLPDDFPADLRRVNPAQLELAGESLVNSWVPVESNSGLNHSGSITAATRFKIGKALLGNITSILYSMNNTIRDIERYDYMEYDKSGSRSNYLYSFNDREYARNIRTGFLNNTTIKLDKNNTFELRNFFNQLSQSQYILRTGIHYDFNYIPENHSFDQVYRGIYTGQVKGEHKINSDKLTVQWIAGYNKSNRDQPDYRRFRSDVDTIENTRTLYIPLGSASAYFLGRFFSEMSEESYSGKLALTWKPFADRNSGLSPEIKAGIYHEIKEREFTARNIGYVRTTKSDPSLQHMTIDQLFQPENINNTNGIRIDEQSNAADSYMASNKQLAGYLLMKINTGKKIEISGGIRMENNEQALDSDALLNPVNNNTIDVLPSANVTYNINKKMLIRSAYGMTINRPEFRELAPFSFYDFSMNVVRKGNSNLKNAKINNFEVRWEYYPTTNEFITLGIFYKNFNNPIETQFVPGGGSGGIKDFTYDNVDGAVNMGIEAEIRKSLSGLTSSKFIDDISIIFNGTLIKSKVSLSDSLVRQSSNRPMQGQAPFIVNAGLQYRNLKNDLQLSLMYNLTGRYIFSIGFDVYPDIYQMPRNLVDLSLSKGLGRHFVVKAGITDLLDSPSILLQDANADGSFSIQTDQVIQRYYPGTSYNLSISYKL